MDNIFKKTNEKSLKWFFFYVYHYMTVDFKKLKKNKMKNTILLEENKNIYEIIYSNAE